MPRIKTRRVSAQPTEELYDIDTENLRYTEALKGNLQRLFAKVSGRLNQPIKLEIIPVRQFGIKAEEFKHGYEFRKKKYAGGTIHEYALCLGSDNLLDSSRPVKLNLRDFLNSVLENLSRATGREDLHKEPEWKDLMYVLGLHPQTLAKLKLQPVHQEISDRYKLFNSVPTPYAEPPAPLIFYSPLPNFGDIFPFFIMKTVKDEYVFVIMRYLGLMNSEINAGVPHLVRFVQFKYNGKYRHGIEVIRMDNRFTPLRHILRGYVDKKGDFKIAPYTRVEHRLNMQNILKLKREFEDLESLARLQQRFIGAGEENQQLAVEGAAIGLGKRGTLLAGEGGYILAGTTLKRVRAVLLGFFILGALFSGVLFYLSQSADMDFGSSLNIVEAWALTLATLSWPLFEGLRFFIREMHNMIKELSKRDAFAPGNLIEEICYILTFVGSVVVFFYAVFIGKKTFFTRLREFDILHLAIINSMFAIIYFKVAKTGWGFLVKPQILRLIRYRAKWRKDYINVLLKNAREKISAGEYDEAIQLCCAIIKKDPGNKGARSIMKQARENAEQQALGQKLNEFLNQAKAALAGGEYLKAISICEQIIKEFGIHKGRVREIREQAEGALNEQKRQAEFDILSEKAQALIKKGNFRAAELMLRRALSIFPGHEQAQTLLNETEDAIREGETRKKVDKLIGRARTQLSEYDYEGVISICERILTLEPGSKEAEHLKSKAEQTLREIARLLDEASNCFNSKKYREAIESCDIVLDSLNPDNQEAAALKRKARDELRKDERQQKIIELTEQAEAHLRKGEYDAAVDLCSRAIEIAPGNAGLREINLCAIASKDLTRRIENGEIRTVLEELHAVTEGSSDKYPLNTVSRIRRRIVEIFKNRIAEFDNALDSGELAKAGEAAGSLGEFEPLGENYGVARVIEEIRECAESFDTLSKINPFSHFKNIRGFLVAIFAYQEMDFCSAVELSEETSSLTEEGRGLIVTLRRNCEQMERYNRFLESDNCNPDRAIGILENVQPLKILVYAGGDSVFKNAQAELYYWYGISYEENSSLAERSSTETHGDTHEDSKGSGNQVAMPRDLLTDAALYLLANTDGVAGTGQQDKDLAMSCLFAQAA